MLAPLRIFLAVGWLRAAAEKLVEPTWWNGSILRSFVAIQRHTALPFFRPLMTGVASPFAVVVAALVLATEIGVGVALIVGRRMRLALWTGTMLNVAFVLSGVVNPSAFYLVMEIVLLLGLTGGVISSAGRSRGRWATPVASGVLLCTGLAMTAYIRTLQPATVIADPAAMLSFLAIMMSGVLCARWMVHAELRSATLRRQRERVMGWNTGAHPATRHVTRPLQSRTATPADSAQR
ncbi:MAG: hypothetical protein ABIQ39_12330 [Ilumatobacteraceae bacterium]